MQNEWSTEWVMSAPYSAATERLRRALKQGLLDICFEVDLGRKVRREAGVRLAKIAVFGVTCPFLLLEGLVGDSAAALFFPLHVMIAERGESVQVSVLSAAAVRTSGMSPAIAIPVHRTLVRLAQAIEGAGARRCVSKEPVAARQPSTEIRTEGGFWR
jgi:uncharacterized protein (DUF302 family)